MDDKKTEAEPVNALILSRKVYAELTTEAELAGKQLHRSFGDDIVILGLAAYRRLKKIANNINK